MSVHAETDQLNSTDIRNAGALRQPLPPLSGVTPGFTPLPRPQSAPVPAAEIFGKQAMANAAEAAAKPPRWRTAFGIAASLLVIGVCGTGAVYLLSQVNASNSGAKSSASGAANGATDTAAPAAAGAGAGADADTEGVAVRAMPAGKTPVFESGVKYTSENLVAEAKKLLAQAGKVDQKTSVTVPVKPLKGKSTLSNDDGVARCMAAVDNAGTRPLAIDVATYADAPATVVIVPGLGGQYEVLVVKPDCGTAENGLIKYEPFTTG